MVGQLYAPDDSRRDAGFSIFYMGINSARSSAPLVCGFLGAAGQLALGLRRRRHRHDVRARPVPARRLPPGPTASSPSESPGLLGRASWPAWSGPRVLFLWNYRDYIMLVGTVALFVWFWRSPRPDRAQAPPGDHRAVRLLHAVLGWLRAGRLELQPLRGSLHRRHVFGWQVPTPLFQALNSIFLVLLAPVLTTSGSGSARGALGPAKFSGRSSSWGSGSSWSRSRPAGGTSPSVSGGSSASTSSTPWGAS